MLQNNSVAYPTQAPHLHTHTHTQTHTHTLANQQNLQFKIEHTYSHTLHTHTHTHTHKDTHTHTPAAPPLGLADASSVAPLSVRGLARLTAAVWKVKRGKMEVGRRQRQWLLARCSWEG